MCDAVTEGYISDQSFVLGDTRCVNNDRASTIILAIVWVFIHAIVLLDTKFPCIMTNRVRLAAPRKMSYMPLLGSF